jgi:hypothetical protein
MAALKTKRNDASVVDFINAVDNEQRKKDAFTLLAFFEKVSQCKAEMWGDAIIGFGSYTYSYESGRELDWMLTGFSPRKQNLSLYIRSGFSKCEDLLAKLGKHKKSKGCLYINKLSDVDLNVLELSIPDSISYLKDKHHGKN